jgi:hypothetical protein
MAEYYPLLARAVTRLTTSTPETRREVYERARKALIGQLRGLQPPVAEADVQRENQALDDAIAQLEKELAGQSAAPAAQTAAPKAASREPPKAPVRPAPSVPPPRREGATPPARPLVRSGNTLRTPVAPPPPLRPGAPGRPPNEVKIPQPPPAGVAPAVPPPDVPQPPVMSTVDSLPSVSTDKPAKSSGWLGGFGRSRASDEDAGNTGDAASDESFSAAPFDEPPSSGNGDAGTRPPSLSHPVAPQPREIRKVSLAKWTFVGLMALVVAGVAILAFELRDNPAEFSRTAGTETPASDAAPGKIVERIGGGPPAQAPAPADRTEPAPAAPAPTRPAAPSQQPAASAPPASTQPSVPVAQRAALLVDAPDDPQKVKTYVGSVVWRLDTPSAGLPVLTATVDLPEARLSVTMNISKDDASKLTTHTIALRFTPAADSPLGTVTAIDTPQMRLNDRPNGDALIGAPAKITDNFFLVGLSTGDQIAAHNLDLIKNRNWFDLPIVLAPGRIAKVTFEKGTDGDRVLAQALAAWGN